MPAEELIGEAQEAQGTAMRSKSIAKAAPIPTTESTGSQNIIDYAIVNTGVDDFLVQGEYENPWRKAEATENEWSVECAGCSESEQSVGLPMPGLKQIRIWAISMDHLVADWLGRMWLEWFMQKEHSCENLRFIFAVDAYRYGTLAQRPAEGRRIFCDFISDTAGSEVNVDDKIKDEIIESMQENQTFFTFDAAQNHIYNMVKRDTYMRFIRSSHYAQALSHAQYHAGKSAAAPTSH